MVLKKVGEFQTTINVNGEEKVSTLQSSDKTYNLDGGINPNDFSTFVVFDTPSNKYAIGGSGDSKSYFVQEAGAIELTVYSGQATLDYEISGGGGGGGDAESRVDGSDGQATTFNGQTADGGKGGEGGYYRTTDDYDAGSDGAGGDGAAGGSGNNFGLAGGGNGGNGYTKTNTVTTSGTLTGNIGEKGREQSEYYHDHPGEDGEPGYIDITITL